MSRPCTVVRLAGVVVLVSALGGCAQEPPGAGMPSLTSPGDPDGATAGPPSALAPAPSSPAPPSASSPSRRRPSAPTCPASALVEEVGWVERADGPALRVRPTADLRACGGPFRPAADPLPGWDDLVLRMPGTDSPGMREQYACHLRLAPDKEVWHLEPWRPVVPEAQMLASLCNPGAPDPDLAAP